MLVRPETIEKPLDISPIIDLAIEYNPMLCAADLSTPRMWVNEGCSIELDILPAMLIVIKRRPAIKSKIGTFSYFTNPVLASRDSRLAKAAIENKSGIKTLESDPEYYARLWVWKRDRLNQEMSSDQIKHIDGWESIHGKIVLESKKKFT